VIGELTSRLRSFLTSCLIVAVRSYQICLRPVLPSVCKFYPSCSEYFIQAVQKYGPVRGAVKGVSRICRCHPWQRGGYDPP
jgi:uncharacterized protein